jgi:hypothetical protein
MGLARRYGIVFAMVVANWAASARGAGATFTNIADTTGPFSSFITAPALNNNRAVTFQGTLDNGDTGVFTIANGVTTPIALTSGPFATFNPPSINDNGSVAFMATKDAGGSGVYRIAGGLTTPIAETGQTFETAQFNAFHTAVAMNNSGNVAFSAQVGSSGPIGTYRGSGGAITRIIDNSSTYSPTFFFTTFPTPDMNSAGAVAVVLQNSGGATVRMGSGGPTTGLTGGTINSTLQTGISINDSGTLLFRDSFYVYKAIGGVASTVASPSGLYEFVDQPLINNLDTTVFRASLDNGGFGIFLGGNPVTDKLIAIGDPLFGSTVANVSQPLVLRQGLNDNNELAFRYTLSNGVQGIAIASIPEPVCGLLLIAPLALIRRRARRIALAARADL